MLIFLIQGWAFSMVCLRCSFDPLTGIVIVCLHTVTMSFPPLPQLSHSLRENTHVCDLIPTWSSQCGFRIFSTSLCVVPQVLHYENMLNSDPLCHLCLHPCPLMAYLLHLPAISPMCCTKNLNRCLFAHFSIFQCKYSLWQLFGNFSYLSIKLWSWHLPSGGK